VVLAGVQGMDEEVNAVLLGVDDDEDLED